MADLPIPFLGRFYQRVFLLGLFIVVLVCVVSWRAYFLASEFKQISFEQAVARLEYEKFPDTYRGRILLEDGTVVAEDKPSWDIAVAWEMIEDGKPQFLANSPRQYLQNSEEWSWIYRRAREQAIKGVGRKRWFQISNSERETLVQNSIGGSQEEWNLFWHQLAEASLIDYELLNERRRLVEFEVEKMATQVYKEQYRRHKANDPGGEIQIKFRRRKLKEHIEHHVILSDISDEVAIDVQQFLESIQENKSKLFNGLIKVIRSRGRIINDPTRTIVLSREQLPFNLKNKLPLKIYIESPLKTFIGSMRDEVSKEAYLNKPFVVREERNSRAKISLSGYKVTDEIGLKGLEAAQEDWLRGRRGARLSLRYSLDQLPIEIEKRAVPGSDIVLTIDPQLQAGIQAIISDEFGLTQVQKWHATSLSGRTKLPLGTPLNSAAVVVEVETGRCIASASNPTYFEVQEKEEQLRRQPWLDRSMQGVYPPGSVVKPLILASAMAEQKMNGSNELLSYFPEMTVDCKGHFFPNNKNIARCWLYADKGKSHGLLQAPEAIARSCNIFFFEIANRLGHDRVVFWLNKFGFGNKPNSGLGYEKTYTKKDGTEVIFMQGGEESGSFQKIDPASRAFQTVMTSIGQGISVTPLQVAKAYGTLLRGGRVASVSVVKGGSQLGVIQESIPFSGVNLGLILKGMEDAVKKDYGTIKRISYGGDSHIIFDPAIARVWAKTGTAQTSPLFSDLDGDGIKERYGGLTHAWTVALASKPGVSKPTHVVVVFVEHGGSGGRVAGPIAAEIIKYLGSGGWL